MKHFIFLLCIIYIKKILPIVGYADSVKFDLQWPIPIKELISVTVTKDFIDKSVLVIEIDVFRKFLKVSKTQYVDIVTDYYTVKRDIIKSGTSGFTIKMFFLKKSYDKMLNLRWFPLGISETDEKNLSSNENIIYSSKILLREKWKVKITMEIEEEGRFYQEQIYFQHGKTAKISCSAFEGLPKSRVRFSGISATRLRNTAYDDGLNTWIGYITLNVNDHDTNITCHVDGTEDMQIFQIKVNHPPTSLILEPEYTGYVKNGTSIKCIPNDGYPVPLLKWDFMSVNNHSDAKSFYQIKNDELLISHDATVGTRFEFNCTSLYRNPLNSELSVLQKTFAFEIGEKPNNIDLITSIQKSTMVTDSTGSFEKLNKAAIGATVAGAVIMVIVVSIVIMLYRSRAKPPNNVTTRQQESPKYSGSFLAASKSALNNQIKNQNGSQAAFLDSDSYLNNEKTELNYDDMPRGRRPIKVVDQVTNYPLVGGGKTSTLTKDQPNLDWGPIDLV